MALRDDIAKEIVAAFEHGHAYHGEDYNPDTCHVAAARVTAMLVERLTGQRSFVRQTEGGCGPVILDRDRLE